MSATTNQLHHSTDCIPSLESIIRRIKQRPRMMMLSDIANAAGVSRSYVAAVIGGRIKNPGYEHIRKIHEYLNAN